MRILFVKLTSMGDLLHALPALTDAYNHFPKIQIDWVIDKNFSEVATWHPAVKNIFTTSHREWRKSPWQTFKKGEINNLLKNIRSETYDLVIDGQTSVKSALITLFSKGIRCGLDKNSAREKIASYAYQKKVAVSRNLHAIKRLRILFATLLNYPYLETQPDYGIAALPFRKPNIILPDPYLVFVHNASWESKLWPEKYWHQLIYYAFDAGLNVVLPWGNTSEKERAERLAKDHSNAYVLPFCSLTEQAYILKHSQGAINCDTGLSHLAAALNVRAVTIYGSTSTKLIGTTGESQLHQEAPFPCTECYQYYCNYNKNYYSESACMLANRPELVWNKFLNQNTIS